MNTLFICLGNVARSQMAEAFYNHLAPTAHAVSAGCLDFTPAKYGHPINEVIKVMQEEGIDVSGAVVKQVNLAMVNSADQLIVLCKKSECPDYIQNSGKVQFWEINDPFGSSLENFRSIRNQIKAKVTDLINREKRSVTITTKQGDSL